MEKVNLRAVRDQLPFGSVGLIAKELGIKSRVVGEVLNKGRARNMRNAVVDVALKIIKDQRNGDVDIVKEAKDLDLTSGHYSTIPTNQKKKPQAKPRKINPLLYVAGGVVALGLLFGKKLLAKIQ